MRKIIVAWSVLDRRDHGAAPLAERRLGGGAQRLAAAEDKRKLNVAYIPVTCHLACPVTDYISAHSRRGNIFIPKMFQGFPEIKEALIANRMQAGFMVAPMAIALRSQGVPIKIVYLGHRYGSAVVVRKDGPDALRRRPRGQDDRDPEPVLRRAADRRPRARSANG